MRTPKRSSLLAGATPTGDLQMKTKATRGVMMREQQWVRGWSNTMTAMEVNEYKVHYWGMERGSLEVLVVSSSRIGSFWSLANKHVCLSYIEGKMAGEGAQANSPYGGGAAWAGSSEGRVTCAGLRLISSGSRSSSLWLSLRGCRGRRGGKGGGRGGGGGRRRRGGRSRTPSWWVGQPK